jgi:hypothetical protein
MRVLQCMASDVKSRFLPDMVKGDLDSLRDDVKLYYTSLVWPMRFDRHCLNSTPECTCNLRFQPRFYGPHEMCASAGRERTFNGAGGKTIILSFNTRIIHLLNSSRS